MGISSPRAAALPAPAAVFHVAVAHGEGPVAVAAAVPARPATALAPVVPAAAAAPAASPGAPSGAGRRGCGRVDQRAGQLLLGVEEQPHEPDDQLAQLHDGQNRDAHPEAHRAADVREQVSQPIGRELPVLHHAQVLEEKGEGGGSMVGEGKVH